MPLFGGQFEGKKVVVTGHTGFKGGWLCSFLESLGADVFGLSDGVLTTPSFFHSTGLSERIVDFRCDVNDEKELMSFLAGVEPDFIFHLAAQAIVSESYVNPKNTVMTNAIGTLNVCEYLRAASHNCVCVLITSDKCYENVEWEYGYREDDQLGGKDVYSASKAAAEVIFHSYYESFLRFKSNIRVCSARAGNVIGGGDWAKDRIVVDMVNSWSSGEAVKIRSPNATRPWQHVLEPISGYLHLAATMSGLKDSPNGISFNFGPRAEQTKTVVELADDLFASLAKFLPEGLSAPYRIIENKPFDEAGLLKLCCDKALFHLHWESNLLYSECIEMIAEWYGSYLVSGDVSRVTAEQISRYIELAEQRGLVWTK